jgi:hypothetical protein
MSTALVSVGVFVGYVAAHVQPALIVAVAEEARPLSHELAIEVTLATLARARLGYLGWVGVVHSPGEKVRWRVGHCKPGWWESESE